MVELSKRLANSLDRIQRQGGGNPYPPHLCWFGGLHATEWTRGIAVGCQQAPRMRSARVGPGRPDRGLRTNPACGAAMSKFTDDLTARISILNQMIPHAKTAERRKLQKERADLEGKLQKVAV